MREERDKFFVMLYKYGGLGFHEYRLWRFSSFYILPSKVSLASLASSQGPARSHLTQPKMDIALMPTVFRGYNTRIPCRLEKRDLYGKSDKYVQRMRV